MDPHPTIVLNNAVDTGRPELSKAGDAIMAALVEHLVDSSHYAQFEICVTAKIIDPSTGQPVGLAELKLPYEIYSDRNPDRSDGTE